MSAAGLAKTGNRPRSEEHTSELQSQSNLVCRLLLEKKKKADWHQNYNKNKAPLIVGDLVVSGTAGGEQGVRGFVAAFDLFFFNDTATTEIYTLSLHDALPI